MKTYAIALDRSKERKRHILQHVEERNLDYTIIDAVDGSLLSQEEIEAACDMNEVNKLKWWLTNGAIGCALSHYKAYEEVVRSGEKAGFVVEDDIVLPPDIGELLREIEQEIAEDEVILLYYTSFKPCRLSSAGQKQLSQGSLVYPMEVSQPITAAAYVIGRQAARNMLNRIKPIRVTADSWSYYYKKGCFSSLRVHYPSLVTIKNFKSSIDYLEGNSLKARLADFINKYKVPILYQVVKFIRVKRLNRMLGHFSLTKEVSPVYQKKIESAGFV